MCILIATTAHPDYSLIALSNRDEFIDRPTATAHFWPDPYKGVLAPCDLARNEHGTWIGVTQTGKFAALLNFHEENSEKIVGEVSRGKFPKDFLSSQERNTGAWIASTKEIYGESLDKAGGFTLVCGEVKSDKTNLSLFSNRPNNKSELFNDDEKTVCISNALIHQSWPKVELGKNLLDETIAQATEQKWSEEKLIEGLFEILSTDTYPRDTKNPLHDLRESIFIPKLDINSPMGNGYGTRTQTLILAKRDGSLKYIEKDVISGAIEQFNVTVDRIDQ